MHNRGVSDFHGHVSRTYHRHGRYEGRPRVEGRGGGSRPAARTKGSAPRELGIYGTTVDVSKCPRNIPHYSRPILHASSITMLNLRFGILHSSFLLVAFANFHEFCRERTMKIGTNGCLFELLWMYQFFSSSFFSFFFLCRIIRLARDEFCR